MGKPDGHLYNAAGFERKQHWVKRLQSVADLCQMKFP
jgi:hypothetical protein